MISDIDFIKACFKRQAVFWTYHVNMRLAERYIARQAILNSLDAFEIIESYPDDKYLPSCLVYSVYQGLIFHVLLGLDRMGENVRIITAYKPKPSEWENDFKRRKKTDDMSELRRPNE